MHTDIHDQFNRPAEKRLSLYETLECCCDEDPSCEKTAETDETDSEDLCCCC